MYNPNLHFHFIGIGGSGMSGLAEVMLNLGFKVSGSDIKSSPQCERLKKLGANIATGHRKENLPQNASLVVYSSAVLEDNPEIYEAKNRGIPIIRRAEVLAELMRLKYGVAVSGSHGKTTTTSIIASVLEIGGLDPTVIIGGQVQSIGSGAKVGKSEFLVAETDESDRSFLLLKPTIAIVTNIDSEHLVSYSSMSDLEECFGKFIGAVPFYGLAVLCIDDPRVRLLGENYSRRKVTYGLSPDADLRAENITHQKGITSFNCIRNGESILSINLPMMGIHFAVNALAAIAVGLEFNVSLESIKAALESFSGVKRRLEIIGEVGGVTIIDDYGHHPTEIKAGISGVRQSFGEELKKLHVVFQPHRFSRTRDCFVEFLDAFCSADNVIITDIYAASEEPIEGISSEVLARSINHPSVQYVSELEDAFKGLKREVKSGDVVLCLGAGSIGGWAERFLEMLNHK